MSVPGDQVQRAIAAARARESQGYFRRVKSGDQKAASLFARLVACDLNPSGKMSDFGWLSKQPGESQVDGYAEDAICWTADNANRENVLDMVNSAGAQPPYTPSNPQPSIGGGVKERRELNRWVKPVPLSQEQLDYLLEGSVEQPQPPQTPVQPYPDEPLWWGKVFTPAVRACYTEAGRTFPDHGDDSVTLDGFRHWSRTSYDIRDGMTKEAAMAKRIKELRVELGLQP